MKWKFLTVYMSDPHEARPINDVSQGLGSSVEKETVEYETARCRCFFLGERLGVRHEAMIPQSCPMNPNASTRMGQ